MFGFVLTFAVTLMHIYVFWRAASVPFLKKRLPLKFLIGTGIILWAIFYLGRVLGHGGSGAFATTLEFLGMTWMATIFLLFVSLLAMDIFTGFGFLLPRLAPSLRGWALIFGGALSLIALFQGLRPPVIKNYEVRLPGLPDEMNNKVIMVISDLHLGSLLGERWLEARIDQVQAQNPDIVVLLGDIFEGHGGSEEEMAETMHRLSAPFGVWAVPGNHESHGRNNGSLSLLEEAGIRILRNNWIEISPGFVLAGVDDLTSVRRSGRGGELVSKALEGRPSGATIFLSHTPWEAEKAAEAGVGLMLSGHTHAGQVWPFKLSCQTQVSAFCRPIRS